MGELDSPTASCLFYLFADRHLPVANKGEEVSYLRCSGTSVGQSGLVALLLGPALWTLQERQLVALALGDAPQPIDTGRLRSMRFGTKIRMAQRPPFLYVELFEESDPRYTERRSVLESVGKHQRRVQKWVDSRYAGTSELERAILRMLHSLNGYAPVWEDEHGQALCTLDDVSYLARMGGYQIADLCIKEARRTGYIAPGWLRGECQGLDALEARHDDTWAAWQAFRDADQALSKALDHRCLIGQELYEVFLPEA